MNAASSKLNKQKAWQAIGKSVNYTQGAAVRHSEDIARNGLKVY